MTDNARGKISAANAFRTLKTIRVRDHGGELEMSPCIYNIYNVEYFESFYDIKNLHHKLLLHNVWRRNAIDDLKILLW